MAICNVFKELTKNNGTFFTFSQYAEDLTINQSNPSYKVIPSRFICWDVDYTSFDNIKLPLLLQNNFENGCSFLRDKLDSNWNPNITKNLFWNEVGQKLFKVDDKNASNIVYCGDINIQSYSEKDNIGYNEIYCYIPNEAKQMSFTTNTDDDALSYQYDKAYICGYSEADKDFVGLLSIDKVYSGEDLSNYQYYYSDVFNVNLNESEVVDSSSFKFNTIVVFYDIYEGEVKKYSDIPLGMFVTGVINEGVMNNSITKYVSNDEIYGAGTSYGLRICNRFTVAPNGVFIKEDANINSVGDDIYPALSEAMSAMVDSQIKMDQILSGVNEYQQGIKDHLAQFKNYRVNVPYILYVNGTPYWFVNGKNTNCKAVSDLPSNFEEGLESIKSDIKDINNDIKDINSSLDAYRGDIISNTNNITETNSEITEINESIKTLNEITDSHSTVIDEHERILPVYEEGPRSYCFQRNDDNPNVALGNYSFVIGCNNIAEDAAEKTFVGGESNAIAHDHCFVYGEGLQTTDSYQAIFGKYNSGVPDWGDRPSLEIGFGYNYDDRRTIFVVNNTGYCADVWGFDAALQQDFAEYFEWFDGNPNDEDRIGYMVQLRENKIEFATSFNSCVGIVTGTAGFVCDTASLEWQGRYLKDDWGRVIYEINEKGEKVAKTNPEYDPNKPYISRDKRKEWSPVGLVGKVRVRQDGTLKKGGYAGCKNGIATDAENGYRVLDIINENIALLLIK